MVRLASGTYYGQKMTKYGIYTLAGSTAGTAGFSRDKGPATASQLHTPVGIALDPAGDIYIADGANNRIREIAAVSGIAWETQMTASDIYTVAGTGTASSTGDAGPAYLANVYFAVSSGTDNYGDLYIGARLHHRIHHLPRRDHRHPARRRPGSPSTPRPAAAAPSRWSPPADTASCPSSPARHLPRTA